MANQKKTTKSMIKAIEETEYKVKNRKLIAMVEAEREKVAGYEQIAKLHCAYIAILLNRLGADSDNPITITKAEVEEAMAKYEARAAVGTTESSYKLYCAVIE